jgi:hypothetical protein
MMTRLVAALVACLCLGFQAKWQVYRSVEGRFSILLPAKPQASERPLQTNQGVVQRRVIAVQMEHEAYSVTYSDYSSGDRKVNAQPALQAARDALVASSKGKLIEEKPMTLDGYPGLSVRIATKSEMVVRGNLILADSRLFQVLVMAPKERIDTADVAKFLGSFRLIQE